MLGLLLVETKMVGGCNRDSGHTQVMRFQPMGLPGKVRERAAPLHSLPCSHHFFYLILGARISLSPVMLRDNRLHLKAAFHLQSPWQTVH